MARDGRRACLERLVFVSAYNLVGAVHGGITVGEVRQQPAEPEVERPKAMERKTPKASKEKASGNRAARKSRGEEDAW